MANEKAPLSLDVLDGDALSHVLVLCNLPAVGRILSTCTSLRNAAGALPDGLFAAAAVQQHPEVEFLTRPGVSLKRLVAQQRALKASAPPVAPALSEYVFVVTVNRPTTVYQKSGCGDFIAQNGWELSQAELDAQPNKYVLGKTYSSKGTVTPDGKRVLFDLPETLLADCFVNEEQYNVDAGAAPEYAPLPPFNVTGYHSFPGRAFVAEAVRQSLSVCISISNSQGRTVRLGPIGHYVRCDSWFEPQNIYMSDTANFDHCPHPVNWFDNHPQYNSDPRMYEQQEDHHFLVAGNLFPTRFELLLAENIKCCVGPVHPGGRDGRPLAEMWQEAAEGWLRQGGVPL